MIANDYHEHEDEGLARSPKGLIYAGLLSAVLWAAIIVAVKALWHH